MSATAGRTTAQATMPARRGRRMVATVIILGALTTLPAGTWMLWWPASFAEFANFLPAHVHFQHDAGAFQIGIGVTLLLALVWTDGLMLALTLLMVSTSIHAINHAVDLDLGGRASDLWVLAAVSLLTGMALWLRLRQLDYVVGEVAIATAVSLAPFVRQKTALLTTYRRDGTPRSSPLSVAVDGNRAYIRSYATAFKTKRMRHNPQVDLCPSTQRGRPTGPTIHAHARELDGAEYRRAANLLRRKHPFLHGLAVPLFHKTSRGKYGETVHFELAPTDDQPSAPS